MDTKNFDSLFSSNEIKLKNQKIGKTLCINLFRAVKTRFGETYLCYNVKHNRIFYANSQLKGYISKLKTDLQVEQGYYFKDVELNSIVEFKIKSIKDDNDQVELEFLKQKCSKDTNEVLDLSDSEIEQSNKKNSTFPIIVMINILIVLLFS